MDYKKSNLEGLYLRKAEKKDCDLLFKWANDEITRKNSFKSEMIKYEDHVKWFESSLNNKNRKQYILMNGMEEVGQVRLDFIDDTAEIGYSIDEFNRGLGYGKSIIALAVNEIIKRYPDIKKIIAKVKPSNVASIRCFLDNGFETEYNQYSIDVTQSGLLNIPSVEKMGGVLFLSNNQTTFDLYRWIEARINVVFYSGVLTKELLSIVNPSLVISYNYSHIVSEECISAVEGRIINLHSSYLPWNRGASPNLWSFIDDTPKGVTIHMLESELDKGDILYQKLLEFDNEKETFETAYNKLHYEMCELFKEHWEDFISGDYLKHRRKAEIKGSYHSVKDLKNLQSMMKFNWSDNIAEFISRYKRLMEHTK